MTVEERTETHVLWNRKSSDRSEVNPFLQRGRGRLLEEQEKRGKNAQNKVGKIRILIKLQKGDVWEFTHCMKENCIHSELILSAKSRFEYDEPERLFRFNKLKEAKFIFGITSASHLRLSSLSFYFFGNSGRFVEELETQCIFSFSCGVKNKDLKGGSVKILSITSFFFPLRLRGEK